MLLVKLGYRNLWRNRRRTLLTMSAMGVATALLIITLGIYDGMLWDMIEGATDVYHGHVKFTAEGYQRQQKIYQTMPDEGLRERLLDDPDVKGAAGRVRGFALLSFGEGEDGHTQPAELFGIAPDEENTVTTLHEYVIEGEFIEASSSHGIVLGAGLARLLEAAVGGEIIAMGQGADGSIAADLFTVRGIVDTNDPVRDSMLAIVGRETLQTMMVLEGRLHEISVSLEKAIEAEQWSSERRMNMVGIDVTPWNEFLPQIGQILKSWDAIKLIFALIFYFAVILVSANTMYMSLLERMREFGIMAAIGFRQKRLSRLVVLEAFIMSAIAGGMGGLTGIVVSFWMQDHPIDLSPFISSISYAETVIQPQLRTYPSPDNMFMPIAMIVLLGVVVSLFPARRLRKNRPVDVLREV